MGQEHLPMRGSASWGPVHRPPRPLFYGFTKLLFERYDSVERVVEEAIGRTDHVVLGNPGLSVGVGEVEGA